MTSETIEQASPSGSPLDETHRRLNATMIERDGWLLPASYGDTLAEYEVVRGRSGGGDAGGAGLIDLSARARIEVSGAEAEQFLNGLITNDVKTLTPGHWMPAAFPNAQGRLIAAARVLRRGDSYLFDVETASHERVFKTLERFTLAGDFRVADLTKELSSISVQGKDAARVVEGVVGTDAAGVERGRIFEASWNGAAISLIRATHTGEDGFDLFVEERHAAPLWDALMGAGARAVGLDALEILRIETGLPLYALDMDETNVVTEAPLDDAVSYTKGCYIGQEIIARIHWRGHVAKKLTGLMFEARVEVERGAPIKAVDDKEIGRVTSVTFSPQLERTIALGYVKYDYLATGTEARVRAKGGQEERAEVASLPFVSGSWFEEPAREMAK